MNVPLAFRILNFMLKIHHRQIVASKTMRSMLDGIRGNLRQSLSSQKREIGFNLAALRVISSRTKDTQAKDFVDEETWEKEEKGPKKRGFVQIA